MAYTKDQLHQIAMDRAYELQSIFKNLNKDGLLTDYCDIRVSQGNCHGCPFYREEKGNCIQVDIEYMI